MPKLQARTKSATNIAISEFAASEAKIGIVQAVR